MVFEVDTFWGVDWQSKKLTSHPQLISYPNMRESNKCINRSQKKQQSLIYEHLIISYVAYHILNMIIKYLLNHKNNIKNMCMYVVLTFYIYKLTREPSSFPKGHFQLFSNPVLDTNSFSSILIIIINARCSVWVYPKTNTMQQILVFDVSHYITLLLCWQVHLSLFFFCYC